MAAQHRHRPIEQLPYQDAELSPDGEVIAFLKDDSSQPRPQIGIVSRDAWQCQGRNAVRWLDLYNAQFSPDGSALMSYERGFDHWFIVRYDIATGATTKTTLPVDFLATPAWAADSTRYLVNVDEGSSQVGRMYYVNPDGTLGPQFTDEGGIVRGYSPSRRHVIVDPALPMAGGEPARWRMGRVVDVQTGQLVNRVPTAEPAIGGVPQAAPLLGWYDDRHVIRYSPTADVTTIEVVDIFTLAVVKSVPAPGLSPLSYSRVRSSATLSPRAHLSAF